MVAVSSKKALAFRRREAQPASRKDSEHVPMGEQYDIALDAASDLC